MEKLVEKAKAGCMDSKAIIIERVRPLILSMIKKYFNYKEEFEDQYQSGVLEVLNGIENFDMEKKVPFIAYIQLRLKYFYLSKYDKMNTVSLDQKMEEFNQEFVNQIGFEDDGFQRVVDMDIYEELYIYYELLTKREKQVINLYYIKDKNMVEIAALLGVSYRTVVNTKESGIKRLRKNFKI